MTFKSKKLFITLLTVVMVVFSLSICAYAAQIDSLSIIDNTIYATVQGENAIFYAAAYNGEGLLSAVFSTELGDDGEIELPVNEASSYKLFLWDKDVALAPVSCVYNLTEGIAYEQGSTLPVPEYEFSGYTFNQEDNVMIVSEISDSSITGFKAGEETTYSFTKDVAVLGLSDSLDDVVPGSVVLIGTNKTGKCAAVELLASVGIPVNPLNFEADYGMYVASDGSEDYSNVLTKVLSKSGTKLTTHESYANSTSTTKTTYQLESTTMGYRVGIAMNGTTPIISCTADKVSRYGSLIVPSLSEYHIYMYLRYNNQTQKVKEVVVYCFPKNYDFTGDGEYSDIYSLRPVIVIE